METGEEGEETIFSAQGKLYALVRGNTPAESGWKERGVGQLKINVSVQPGEDTVEPTDGGSDDGNPGAAATVVVHRKARLLMRAMGVYRVMLNSPVYKGMNLRTTDGGLPSPTRQYKQLMFTVIEDGKPVMMQLKVGLRNTLLYPPWTKLTLASRNSFATQPIHTRCIGRSPNSRSICDGSTFPPFKEIPAGARI